MPWVKLHVKLFGQRDFIFNLNLAPESSAKDGSLPEECIEVWVVLQNSVKLFGRNSQNPGAFISLGPSFTTIIMLMWFMLVISLEMEIRGDLEKHLVVTKVRASRKFCDIKALE